MDDKVGQKVEIRNPKGRGSLRSPIILYGKGTLKGINDNWGHIFNPQKIYDF